MIRAVIIDDEAGSRKTINNILKFASDKIIVVGFGENVASGFEIITEQEPDLVFLDIRMPDGSGFDLLAKFEKINFRIIFITAYNEYAVKAFKFSALDYLLKPINAEELLNAVDKFPTLPEEDFTDIKLKSFAANLESIKKIVLRTSESIHIIPVKDIIHCESDGSYTHFYLNNQEKLLVSKSLKEYDDMLEPFGFFRAHQSHLINLECMTRFDKTDGGAIIMSDGSEVPVAKRKKEQLFRILEQI